MGSSHKKAKTIKLSDYSELDTALFIWICQLREKNVPVSGPLIAEKAKQFFKATYLTSIGDFIASSGFLWRFCKRQGLKDISIQGEKISADIIAADEYVSRFADVVAGYSRDHCIVLSK